MEFNGNHDCHSIAIKKYNKPIKFLKDLLEYINNPDLILEFLKQNINKINVILYINNHTKDEKPFYNFYETFEQMMELNEYSLHLSEDNISNCHAFMINYNDNILDSELLLFTNQKKKNVINNKIYTIDTIDIDYNILNNNL
jgi:hypothetical protein